MYVSITCIGENGKSGAKEGGGGGTERETTAIIVS